MTSTLCLTRPSPRSRRIKARLRAALLRFTVAAALPAIAATLTGCAAPHHHRDHTIREPAAPPTPIEVPAAPPPPIAPPAAPAPQPEALTIGTSLQGRPIRMEIFGDGPDALLVIGGIHGNEPTGAALAQRLAGYLRQHPASLRGRTIAIIARANPDGLAAKTRENAAGVDINRNFPASNWHRDRSRAAAAHGDSPASAPETQALIEAIQRIRPTRVLSLHSIGRGRYCNNFDGPAQALAQAMSRENGYPVAPTMGYATPGSLGTWLGIDRGIPIITLELPRDADADSAWHKNRAALLTFITATPVLAR